MKGKITLSMKDSCVIRNNLGHEIFQVSSRLNIYELRNALIRNPLIRNAFRMCTFQKQETCKPKWHYNISLLYIRLHICEMMHFIYYAIFK